MIITVCTDDAQLLAIAQQSTAANPAVFGAVFQVFTPIPQVAPNENLFLIAHGAKAGDDGNPVIGDQANAFFVNAVELYLNIKSIFPAGYAGDVYIDACEAADHTPFTFSFAEVFLAQIRVAHGNTRVFGRNGAVGGLIPLPNNPGWVQAH